MSCTSIVERTTRVSKNGCKLLFNVLAIDGLLLLRLASHICGYKCFQIELSRGYDYAAFHDDIKKLYDMAGVQNQDTVFLFTDTQVIETRCDSSIAFRPVSLCTFEKLALYRSLHSFRPKYIVASYSDR